MICPSEKRLLFVTGTRADFGKIEPLARVARDAGFAVSFFITGMHMMKRYGETRLEVRKFTGAEFFELVNQRENDELDFVLAKTVLGFSDFVYEHKPDLVIVHGDRTEALAASIVCAMRNIRSAHIEGGEVSGTIDESIRHCNSKLCTHHFVSSNQACARIKALGEGEERISVIGSPELDTHRQSSVVSIEEVRDYYDIWFDEFGVAVFHPVTSEADSMGEQADCLFGSLVESGRNFVVISPNNDPGSSQIFKVIERLPTHSFRIIPSMRFNYFSRLLKSAALFVGNSSVGVREAPFLGVPSINVGSRQNERAHSPSISKCLSTDVASIGQRIKELWGKRFEPSMEFGDGFAAKRFIDILCLEEFWEVSLQKNFNEYKH